MIPERLHRGDVIGVVSPSAALTVAQQGQLEAGTRALEGLGLSVQLAPHARSAALGFAASPQEKAADINSFFADASIQAIICSQGGDSANSCLPYLDWDTIARNPKIIVGISDITVLLNAIQARTGLVTFHGNDLLWGFGRSPTSYDVSEFQRRLFDAELGPIPPSRERTTIRSGTVTGRLLGGNLRCLLKLAGTPYFPDSGDSILFLEALDIRPESCHALLHQLKQIGVFAKTKGCLVGYIDGLQQRPNDAQMESVLLEVTSDMTFPILKTNDFGHNCPNTVLPVGARILLDADARSVELVEPIVR